MAAWTAAEIFGEFKGDVGISLTPVGSGRFEVLLDGEEVFNNKVLQVNGISMGHIQTIKMTLHEKLAALTPAG
jgi:predicted Rdx family selenoprotein